MLDVLKELIVQASFTLLAAALAAWLAVLTYFRQREHELILSRYLEGGLDLLAAEVSRVTETFSHNWARCLTIIKSYRDLEGDFDLVELNKGFLELQSSKHNIVAHHRLFTLIGTHEYWTLYQHAMAYYTSANSVLVNEIPETIRVKLSSETISATHQQIVEEAFPVAKDQDDGSNKFVGLVAELQCLAAALESKRYRFKTLSKFRNVKEVKESLGRVRQMLTSIEGEEK